MKKALLIFIISFVGFIIFQLLVPFAFGMGEIQLGKLEFTAYGLYLDKEREESWIVTLNWLMRGYGSILINSLQFAIAALLFSIYYQSRKTMHSVPRINWILLGFSLYLTISSILKFAVDMSYDYATHFVRTTNLSLIEKIATFSVFANVLLLILLTFFIFNALRKNTK